MQVLLAGIVHTHIHFAAVIESTSCEVYPNQADLLSWISTLAIVFGLASNVAPGKLTVSLADALTSFIHQPDQGWMSREISPTAHSVYDDGSSKHKPG
ncbi:cortexin domain-containing 1 protein isoform X3 [Caretta caretta]|uniref:cortexin domain-containing 1 protein isoform X3 n=1 Tax=Caretta caretta TaxID=8467 RepID=UPI003F4BA687